MYLASHTPSPHHISPGVYGTAAVMCTLFELSSKTYENAVLHWEYYIK